jgi:hypothetical protein
MRHYLDIRRAVCRAMNTGLFAMADLETAMKHDSLTASQRHRLRLRAAYCGRGLLRLNRILLDRGYSLTYYYDLKNETPA